MKKFLSREIEWLSNIVLFSIIIFFGTRMIDHIFRNENEKHIFWLLGRLHISIRKYLSVFTSGSK